ncbi:Dyp-type peroxidase [Leucobacter sp. USHLN153]|uniref:Dyp-type peroxidase n=1 Tax=Leucobacter sp. USHLN153 TaxID=3081268 RepID=UPI003018636E
MTAEQPPPAKIGRRALLTGGAVSVGAALGLGAALGVGGTLGAVAIRRHSEPDAPRLTGIDDTVETSAGAGGDLPGFGGEALSCHGPHQAGIATVPAAHLRYVAYALRPETDRAALERLFRVLTDDVEGLTAGTAPLADPEPELAARPARLTVTIGVGRELVERVDPARRPPWLGALPAFDRDALDGRHDGGDLLMLMQADDPLPIAHAARMLDRDIRGFADPLWTQQGFRQARGADAAGATMRNLMGQVDETVNPRPEDEDFDGLVWIAGGASQSAPEADPDTRPETEPDTAWLAGGTALVLRRIRMRLETWDRVDRPGRELSIGRRLSDGAPLTGGSEHTPIDFDAKNAAGLPVIPAFAHARRAHSSDPAERIVRRSANFDDGTESGLLFACFQRDPLTQFVPIQRRLDELDLLNEWIEHTGSAVYAILPGFAPGDALGAALFR